ncbi:MAG: hypothetical protein ACPGVG_05160 [Mycobacterium sp.]
MKTPVRHITLVVSGVVIALGSASPATAAPDCSDVGSTVTFCETKGSTQLITTPPPWRYGGWQGFGFGPLIGGFGLGL